MELKQETICEDTLEFIQEYYRLNTEPLFSVLADDNALHSDGDAQLISVVKQRATFCSRQENAGGKREQKVPGAGS